MGVPHGGRWHAIADLKTFIFKLPWSLPTSSAAGLSLGRNHLLGVLIGWHGVLHTNLLDLGILCGHTTMVILSTPTQFRISIPAFWRGCSGWVKRECHTKEWMVYENAYCIHTPCCTSQANHRKNPCSVKPTQPFHYYSQYLSALGLAGLEISGKTKQSEVCNVLEKEICVWCAIWL